MDIVIQTLIRIAAVFLVALAGWVVFPDSVTDLTYGQWVSITVVAFFALGLERVTSET